MTAEGRRLRLRKPAMLISTSAAMLAIAIAQPAFAQDATTAVGAEPVVTPAAGADVPSDVATGQDIVVTGSRIVRRDYSATSPIVTADRQLFERSSTSSIEQNLNKLPQFSPTLNTPSAGAQDIQPTSRNTPGSATISLRGLGANRTLVLIDGRRGTPSNATGVVDINTLPASAIERVEIISGGASSTYGADAVAGVTNFILRKSFSGLELDAQMGLTEAGDGKEYSVSGIMGTDFADGRGNVSIAMGTNRRYSAFNRNRKAYRDLWANPNLSIFTTGFLPQLSGVVLSGANAPSQAVINDIFNQVPPGAVPNAGITLYTNPDGSVFSGVNLDFAGIAGTYRSQITDGYRFRATNLGVIAPTFTDSLSAFPTERYNMLMNGSYEVSDNITVFGQGLFSKTSSFTSQEPAPIFNFWSAFVPYNSLAPQADLTPELIRVLNSRPNPNDPFQIYTTLPFNRTTATDVFTYTMIAGLRGSIPGSDWTWEVYGQRGETQSTATQAGFGSLQRYRAVIASGNFGAGFVGTSNPEFNGFASSTATCTSGLNPFSGAPISQDCIEAISADIKSKSTMEQTIWEATAQGTLFNLPAGGVKAAVGASYRNNDYQFDNDTLTTQGRSFLEQAIGLYPSGNSSGVIIAKEVFGELLIPILADRPFFKSLNLEVGGRYSNYNTTGSSYTYKVAGDWELNDWFRVRGGYNRAERAPNIAELFLAPEQSFVLGAIDACSTGAGVNFSANPATNPNAANVRAICSTLITRAGGSPAAFYANPLISASPTTNAFPTTAGNRNVQPEKADTWTAGVVISSPFRDNDLFSRLRLSVDYYNIKVTDAIAPPSALALQQLCFSQQYNPTYDANAAACQLITRVPTGELGNLTTTFLNNGRFKTSGVDAQLDWSIPIGPGQINLNTVFSYLIEMKSAELPLDPYTEFKGSLGPNANGLNGGSYDWKLFTTLGYSWDGNSLSLQWRHLPKVDVATEPQAAGRNFEPIDAYDLFNLSGTVAISRDLVMRGGVENLFNKRPPLTGVNVGSGIISAPYNAQFYDIIGRRYYVGMKAKF